MTVTLTDDTVNARVSIAVDSLGDATACRIERSTDQIRWTTVRGAVALPVTAGALADTHHDYEFAPNVVNHYRATPIPAGLWLSGNVGDYASTPDTAVLDIIGDIDLRVDATLDAWVSGVPSGVDDYLISKYQSAGDQRSFGLFINEDATLRVAWTVDGISFLSLTATALPVPDPDTGRLAVRATLDVNNGAGGKTATFYTAPTLSGPWTQLGDPVVQAGTTSIFSGTANLVAGAINDGTSNMTPGFFHAVEVRNGINGTVVANPDFEAQADNDTSFVDGAGRTWTVNGTAEIVTAQTNSITPALTAVWLKSPQRPFLNQQISLGGRDFEVERATRGETFDILDRSLPVATSQPSGSRQFDMLIRTTTDAAAQTLEYAIASGDVLFVHAPTGKVVPAGGVYVKVDRARMRLLHVAGTRRHWSVPVTEVAPPGPDVAYALLTWQTILSSYANFDALLAANATWDDLLQLLAQPSEVIVS